MENVIKSIKYLGFEPTMIEEKNQLSKLSHLINTWGWIFPRNDGYLKKSKIGEILKNYTNYDIKIMGRKIGMHILFENSEEFINKKD